MRNWREPEQSLAWVDMAHGDPMDKHTLRSIERGSWVLEQDPEEGKFAFVGGQGQPQQRCLHFGCISSC